MSELILDRDERLRLRARAHHLNPVVLLGAAGLTEAVVKETDRALAAHELIKVRIPGDDRDEREAIGAELAQRLGAARVQAIGKLLVLYRPRPEKDEGSVGTPPARGAAGKGQTSGPGRAAAGKPAAARPSAPPGTRPPTPDRGEKGKARSRKPLPGARRSAPPSRGTRADKPAGRRGGGRPR